jgi:hypothetical protein
MGMSDYYMKIMENVDLKAKELISALHLVIVALHQFIVALHCPHCFSKRGAIKEKNGKR